jgi:hypothetical protein
MAIPFNGTDQYAYASAADEVLSSSAGPWTLAFWVKMANLTQTNKYLYQQIKSAQTSIIWEYTNNLIEFYATSYSGTNPRTDSGITIGDTNWHHICYRKAASGTSAYDKFLDGSKTTINASIAFTLADTSTTQKWGSTGTTYCACSLAEWATYGSALTDEQVGLLASGYYPTSIGTAPAKYWPWLNSETEQMDGLETTLVGSPSFAPLDHPAMTSGELPRRLVCPLLQPLLAQGI